MPPEARERYRDYIIGVDWNQKTLQAHDEIWAFNQELNDLGIRHIFFNGNNDFDKVQDRRDWKTNYIGPYDSKSTFDAVIRSQGIDTVMPGSWHFGRDGHAVFYRFILDYIIKNKFI